MFLSTYGGVDNSVHYFRDEKGLEVDLIVEHDGRWGAIEVKLSNAKADDGARNLKALEKKVFFNPAAQNAAPAFLAVVVGGGHRLHTRRRRGSDPHDDTWGVVVLLGGVAEVSLPKIHLLNLAPVGRIESTAAQVLVGWAAPLLRSRGQCLTGVDPSLI